MPAEITSFPEGGPGFIAVTDLWPGVTVTEPATAVSRQIRQIADGTLAADVFTKNVPKSDVTDPFTNPNGGAALSGDPESTPISDELGGAVDDFIEIWRAYLLVEEPGPYTFQFHTDDGFVAKIPGRT